jgi:hypothetical protein
MNIVNKFTLFVSFSTLTGLSLFLAGCSRNPDISDEFARISSQEVSNMDANTSMGLTSGFSKTAAGDTINYDLVIHPYSWDAASGSYIRTAVLTGTDGYERTRVDTVTFYGNAGTLQHPTLATVDSIHHVRHVTRTRGGRQLNIIVDMHSTVSATPSGYTHVKNGTISGTYDGEQVATGTINDVTRNYYTLTHWQLWPVSGSITADFPRRLYEVNFLGAGLARLTITNKATDKTRTVTISVDQK